MIARLESCIVLSDNERTLEILLATLEPRINDTHTSSVSGRVSGDSVFIFLLYTGILTVLKLTFRAFHRLCPLAYGWMALKTWREMIVFSEDCIAKCRAIVKAIHTGSTSRGELPLSLD